MLDKVGVWVERLARWVAIAGGIVLVAIAIMTGISITGRAFLWAGLRPVPGDFELVEAGMGFAIAAFMPWTQLKKGHASVAVLTDFFPPRVNAFIDLAADALLFLTSALLAWRLAFGMLDKLQYGETTFILQYPLWWSYGLTLFGLIAWFVTGAWCTWASVVAFSRGASRAGEGGVVH